MTSNRTRKTRPARRANRPRLESLEPRLALSASPGLGAAAHVVVSGDTLTIEGTPRADRIQVLPTKLVGVVRVVFNGKAVGSFGPVARIDVSTGDGADSVVVDPRITLPTRIDGGAGNDRLQGGSGPNVFHAGAGNDVLIGTPGRDTFDGGAGRTRSIYRKNLGVVQVSASASGAGLHRLSGSYTLMPLAVAGPAVVGAADLGDANTVALLKSSYEGGQTVSIANATEADATALAGLLGDPRPVDLPDGVSRADLVSFRKVTEGGQTTFSVYVVLPVPRVAIAPARRAVVGRFNRQSDRAYLGRVFTPTPSPLAATKPVGDPGGNVINLANSYFVSQSYNDGQGDIAQLENTVYSVRSFGEQLDYHYVTQEVQLTSASSTIGQVGIGGHVTRLNPTTPGLLGNPEVIQPGPPSTGVITQYTTAVIKSFSGSVGWNQTSGFNASIGGGVSLSNSITTVVPPVTIQYFPNLNYGTTNWLFISNNNNLPQFTATDSWIWVVPLGDYSPGQLNLPFTSYTDVGPVTGATTYQFEYNVSAPLPFGDIKTIPDPVVTGVSVPTVAPGQEFTINGTGFYPFLVEGVVIGGQGLSPSSFKALNDGQIQVVAPNTPGNGLSVIVNTSKGLSNSNITINISGASQVSVQAQAVVATAGQAFTNAIVATVTDSDANASPSGFAATIDWGDGSTSNGTVASTGSGTYAVLAGHTYATAGSYTFTVQVTDPLGTKGSASGTAIVTGSSNGPQDLVAQAVAATAGQAFANQTVGTFSSSSANAQPGDFAATITWGDGSSSNGTIASTGSGTFAVLAGHTYATAGSYDLSLEVTGPGNTKATVSGTATVAAASSGQPQDLAAPSFTAAAGQAFNSQTVGTFTSSGPNANPADFAATVTWGDGSTSNGTIASTGGGAYLVLADHTYASAGSYNVSVDVTGPGNSKVTATGTATVASTSTSGPANLVTTPVSAVANQVFTNVIMGTFTDFDSGVSPGDFVAAIDWGDGIQTASTTVTSTVSHTFNVLGTHTYVNAGTYTFSIQVTDSQNKVTSATGTVTVTS